MSFRNSDQLFYFSKYIINTYRTFFIKNARAGYLATEAVVFLPRTPTHITNHSPQKRLWSIERVWLWCGWNSVDDYPQRCV